MKTTQERLAESFCRPNTEEETERLMDASRFCGFSWNVWIHEGNWLYFVDGEEFNLSGELEGRTEIPVQHFIDLLTDSIAAWRLEDDGFTKDEVGDFCFDTTLGGVIISWDADGCAVFYSERTDAHIGSIPTYTDLLTLIRLIG